MADAITLKALQDASLDAKSLEEVVNGNKSKQVTTRKGETYPSVKKAIKTLFENGGLPATPFATKALMEASELVDGVYAVVTDDTEYNNGLYIKEAGSWVVSSFLKGSMKINDVRVVADTAVSSYVRGNYNLLDMDTLTRGIISVNGTENIGFSNYFFTTFIPVDVGEVYSLVNGNEGNYANEGFWNIAYYNDSFEFIKRVDVVAPNRPSEIIPDSEVEGRVLFTPPDDVYYIRISLRKNGVMYIYKGSDIKPFVRYGAELSAYTQLSNTQKGNLLWSAKKEVDEDYLVTGENLLDIRSLLHGYSLANDTSGEIIKNYDFSLSDYIPVIPNQRYTATSKNNVFMSVLFYDSEKKPFIRADIPASGAINTPEHAYFMRLNIRTNAYPAEGNEVMVNVGEALPYQPFFKRIKNSLLDNIVAQPVNLFDYTKAIVGFIVSNEGSVVEHVDYSVSDFIPVEPSTKYAYSFTRETGNAFLWTATYDKNKQFIERIYTVGGADSIAAVHEFDPHVAYIRLSMHNGRADQFDRMFNKGTTRGRYESGTFKTLEDVKFGELPTQAIKDIAEDTYLNKPTIDMPMQGVFHNTKDSTYFTQFADWRDRPAADVISLFESLRLQHPQYITKEVLGEDLDGDEILLYKFTPEKISHNSHVPIVKRPKVFLTLATHGYEHLGPLSTYLMLERLANEWTQDPLLEALRFNVEFLVIPIVNMYAYDRFSRWNKNGVDINRNFPEGWRQQEVGSARYSGEYPLSELESQYISSVFDKHPDIDIMFDYHTFTGPDFTYLWILTKAGQLMEQVGHNFMTRMSHKYAKDLDFLPKDYIRTVGYVDRTSGGFVHDHANGKGIRLAAVIETSRYWGDESGLVTYDETHCITAYESITNLILLSVDTLVSK